MRFTIWDYGEPEPEGVTVVFTRDTPTRFAEWRRTERGWYCHTAWGRVPGDPYSFARWDVVGRAFGRIFSRPVMPGECIRRDA